MNPVLADAVFWIAVACCVVAQVAILRSVMAARRGAVSPPARQGREILWAVLPALALAATLLLTWRAMHPRTGSDHIVIPVAPPAAGITS